jgi:hypothetical protein
VHDRLKPGSFYVIADGTSPSRTGEIAPENTPSGNLLPKNSLDSLSKVQYILTIRSIRSLDNYQNDTKTAKYEHN